MPGTEPRYSQTFLQPIVSRLGRPTVRTTYQLLANALPAEGEEVEALFSRSVNVALRWLRQRFPLPLPPQAEQGKSFECEVPGQSLQCVAIHAQGVWSVRLIQPDMPFKERQAVPGRTWTSEIALRRTSNRVLCGVRVVCASLPFATEAIALTRPTVVLTLAAECRLHDVRPLSGRSWHLRNDVDLHAFRQFLTDEGRQLPVYLLTEADEGELGLKVRRFLLDEDRLAQRLFGLGHVVTIPAEISYRWTELVGKSWAAFRGAVRTYRPGLKFGEDPLSSHPLALATRVLAFTYGDLKSEEAFTEFLIDQAHRDAAARRVEWADCAYYVDALGLNATMAREMALDESDWRSIYDQEIASLRAKVVEREKEAEEWSEQAVEAGKVRDNYVEENRRLQAHVDALRRALAVKTGQTPDAEIAIPQTYDDLPEWVEEHLVGRLILHPRARQGIKEAIYEEVSLVYQSLLLLANDYRDMRLGITGDKERWEAALQNLRLKFSGSIDRARAGEEGDTYFVRYPLHTERKEFLEFHLRRGTSHDHRRCLAVYFFWDAETQQVVVGWLPSHLENRLT